MAGLCPHVADPRFLEHLFHHCCFQRMRPPPGAQDLQRLPPPPTTG